MVHTSMFQPPDIFLELLAKFPAIMVQPTLGRNGLHFRSDRKLLSKFRNVLQMLQQ